MPHTPTQKISWSQGMDNFRREQYPHETLTGLAQGVYALGAPDDEASKIMFQVTGGYITFIMGQGEDIPVPSATVGFRVDEDSGIVFVEFLHHAQAKIYVHGPYVTLQVQWGK